MGEGGRGKDGEICGLSNFQGTDLVLPAEGVRAVERHGAKRGLADASGRVGLGPQIQLTHADYGVGSESHRDASVPECSHWRQPMPVRAIRERAVGDRRVGRADQLDIRLIDLHAMDAQGSRSYDSTLYEIRDRCQTLGHDDDAARL